MAIMAALIVLKWKCICKIGGVALKLLVIKLHQLAAPKVKIQHTANLPKAFPKKWIETTTDAGIQLDSHTLQDDIRYLNDILIIASGLADICSVQTIGSLPPLPWSVPQTKLLRSPSAGQQEVMQAVVEYKVWIFTMCLNKIQTAGHY